MLAACKHLLLSQSGEGVPEGAGMEEPLYRVRTGSVYVPHREDEGARSQGDSREYERRALAAFLR